MIFFYIINFFLCLWMARRDATLIKRDKKPNHGRNGAIHLLTGLLVATVYGWPHFLHGLYIFAAWLCECAVVFDVALALFRGLNPFYVSPNPKSWKDKIEKFIFRKNGVLPKIFYLIIFIVCVTL